MSALDAFRPATRAWFEASFSAPTEVQERGWARIQTGESALLVAPTGSGKTLAAFLAGLDSLAATTEDQESGVRVLYVSPLKALVYDVERNLRAPLAGIRATATRLGTEFPEVRVDIRTGDTPAADRRRQQKNPGEILVTTPESLYLLLGSQARETLRTVHTVILDEVHALAPSKRGAHLSLSLERLSELTDKEPQRIALSATVRPLEEIAAWVGGSRPVEIVDASSKPSLDLKVHVPVEDMSNPPIVPEGATANAGQHGRPGTSADSSPDGPPGRRGGSILGQMYDRDARPASPERGVWAAILPKLLEEIRRHRTTILFVNSRGLCERLAQRLNELAEEELVRAHHGSVSHEQRAEMEEALKAGRIPAIVATSSLELGIDMGTIDCVLLVESPGTAARGLQRVGRSGHGVGETSRGRIFPKFRGDLLECAVVSERMQRGELEAVRYPRNALDVLAQQIVAMCADTDRTVEDIQRIVTRAAPYRELGRATLEALLDMLSGRYPSEEFADLRPWLSWDRGRELLSARRGAALVARFNAGTIPDRGLFAVHTLEGGPRVGELDEEMVHEMRAGDHILLGASTWRVEEITRDRVLVVPTPGEPGRLPFWHGDGPGRPIEIGRAIGAFLRELSAVPKSQAEAWIQEKTPLDELAAKNLAAYVAEQEEHSGALPTDRQICLERFRDELGDWRVCLLTPFGARIHAPWAAAIQRRLENREGFEAQVMYSEEGIVLRFADGEELPNLDELLISPEDAEELITDQLADTALFAGLFRENATRSLLLPRRGPNQRNPLWAQRLKSQQLLASVRKYPSFPIVLETYREVLQDHFDLEALRDVLGGIQRREIHVHEAETTSASPFARSLVFAYVAAFMYEQDQPLAERRAQALTVDPALLRELLGQGELRELLDAGVVDEVEEALQRLREDQRARDADEVHDLLRRLGDLGVEEIAARSEGDPRAWLERLRHERRAIPVSIAGEPRWIAAEDAGLFRDTLGVPPPPGLPSTYLAAIEAPLERLLRRWARTHGPFLATTPAARWGLGVAAVEEALRALLRTGVLSYGEIRPGGTSPEWCDTEVLRRLKRQTLARLRKQVAPVDARRWGAFLPAWHGIGRAEAGSQRLLDAIGQLEGVSLPWSELRDAILPARVSGFRVDQLDALSTAGQVLWIGQGALGRRDGRVALYLRENVATLLPPPETEIAADDELAHAILDALSARGASFAVEIEREVKARLEGTRAADIKKALWSLAWDGHVTNDTFSGLSIGAKPDPPRGFRGLRRRAAGASGRWSAVRDLFGGTPVSETERALALSQALLDRYGVVSREATAADGVRGGFASVYRVLREQEDTGLVRRGHFVEGLSGAQFAIPAAIDRLRAERDPGAWQVLSAVDPANVWGATLPWPELGGPPAPRRVAGARVVQCDGWPVVWVAASGRSLLVFPPPAEHEDPAALLADALRQLPATTRARLRVEKINGASYRDWPDLRALKDQGLAVTPLGLVDART